MIKMTAAETAYMESGGAIHPETGKPAEEAASEVETPATEKPVEAHEEAATEEAKPEAETEEGDDSEEEVVEVEDGNDRPKRKMIDKRAYDKLRYKTRGEIDRMSQQLAFLTGALQQVQSGKPATEAQQQQVQQISATPPDYKTKPQEWLDWVNQTVAHAATFTQQQGQMTAQQQQFSQLNDAVVQHEQAFVAGDPASGVEAHPDFYDALKFLQDRHKAELTEAGYDAPTIQKIMAARAQDVAQRALAAGKSPAERVYAIAKVQGYRKAAPKVEPKAESEAEKVARQAAGQSKAKSISNLSGGAEKGMSIDVLANTPQAQFNKLWKEGKAQEIMGITGDY